MTLPLTTIPQAKASWFSARFINRFHVACKTADKRIKERPVVIMYKV